MKDIDSVGKRYRFQTKLPIVGDEEGLLLTSYQSASEHTAQRILETLGEVPVLEICCGVGGTTIFLAQYLPHIYAVDLNPKRLEAARINAKTFGVEKKITFIEGNGLNRRIMMQVKEKGAKASVSDVEWRDDTSKSLAETTPDILKTIPSTPPLYHKLHAAVAPEIVMHMAANTDKNQLREMADCEIEEMYYEGTCKFINVYFGKLAKGNIDSKHDLTNTEKQSNI